MLKVRNLRYKYHNSSSYAVDGLDFDINDGEIFGFLGPSGAGKSTTQKILIKLLRGFKGEIEYHGKPLTSYGDSFYEDIGEIGRAHV